LLLMGHLVHFISCFMKKSKVPCYMYSIAYLKNPEAPKFYESVLASGTAGALAGVIVNPLDIVKLRMQV